jgi:hypothetical protein
VIDSLNAPLLDDAVEQLAPGRHLHDDVDVVLGLVIYVRKGW